MSSRIITPPDNYFTDRSYLIINAKDGDIDTLVLWLKTVPETYDIHLWHIYMPDTEMWAMQSIIKVQTLLVNLEFVDHLPGMIKRQLDRKQPIFFGPNSDHQELIHYFLRNRP